MVNRPFRLAGLRGIVACCLVAILFSGCDQLQRMRSFRNAKNYFIETKIADHDSNAGSRASWHVIKDPDASIPWLLERIHSDDIATAGTAILLLQAMAGRKCHDELLKAIDEKDWSTAPGHIVDYINIAKEPILRGEPGVIEGRKISG